jgi:hypothetical protein
MAFDSFKSIAEVLTAYQITSKDTHFLGTEPFSVPDSVRADLAFYQAELSFDESESAVCEMIIFPILSTVYRQHYQRLTLWSHKTITYDEQLTGIPVYMMAKRSPLGKVVLDKPYFVAVEAKKDDFSKGWGQCLAQLVAMQKINDKPEQPVYGIVTNGQLWQFGRLFDRQFTKELQSYVLSDLDELMAALNFLFQCCEEFS